MTEIRYYSMVAKENKGEDLHSALTDLAEWVRELDGCLAIDIYRDAEQTLQFHFLEHWTDRTAHKEAGARLSKDAFARVMDALAEPPFSTYLIPVSN